MGKERQEGLPTCTSLLFGSAETLATPASFPISFSMLPEQWPQLISGHCEKTNQTVKPQWISTRRWRRGRIHPKRRCCMAHLQTQTIEILQKWRIKNS
jgi:hypothetical protein